MELPKNVMIGLASFSFDLVRKVISQADKACQLSPYDISSFELIDKVRQINLYLESSPDH